MSISVTLSVGYSRRRPDTKGDRLESRMDSAGLMLAGAAIVILVLVWVLPRVLSWLGTL